MSSRLRGPREPYAVVDITVTVTVELPADRAQDGVACDDPAIEAALAALPQMIDVYVWGEHEPPARVYVEASEVDANITEDCR